MNPQHPDDALLGLRALRRAAKKVEADARRKGYAIPYWIDGRIQYIVPGPETENEAEDEIEGQFGDSNKP